MSLFQFSAMLALVVNAVLGVLVLRMNPGRRVNKCFVVASVPLLLWLATLVIGSWTRERALLLFWIRQSSVVSALLPAGVDLLRIAIADEAKPWRKVGREMLPWSILLPLVAAICQAPSFLLDVGITSTGFGRPTYGVLQVPYMLYWVFSLGLLIWRFRVDLKRLEGIRRAELEFTVLAFAAATAGGVGLVQVSSLLAGYKDLSQLAPLFAIVFAGTVAYGIVTRRIMSVGDVLRRLTAYALLVSYLLALYVVVLVGCERLFFPALPGAYALAHGAAAMAVAFSMAPAHGRMQRVADRLFINMQAMDIPRTIQEANRALMSIGTTGDLMARFSEIVVNATGTDRTTILLVDEAGDFRTFAKAANEEAIVVSEGDVLLEVLRESPGALSIDAMRRMRADERMLAAERRLLEFGASMAVGVHAKGKVDGILLLGPRLSGKIYSSSEQDALQLICDQLGIAMENAKLYTEVQNGKIYNDILLDSLVSGTVAMNAQRVITVFNREARRVTGLTDTEVVGCPVSVLPEPVARALESTLETGQGLWDSDLTITKRSGARVPVRLSSSVFHGHTADLMGSLVVFSDMTQLRKLEDQVRRTDRLASLGTLSAGMAHEIKNPLVSIKTFTQLLPERYQDSEFRDTFFSLIGEEVQRIDSIVNRLLSFARPPEASLVTIGLHAILVRSLSLLEQQMRKQGVVLTQDLGAESDLIQGDRELLGQALVNFLLNAVQAMPDGGELTVTTEIAEWGRHVMASSGIHRERRLRLRIVDTGLGVKEADLPRIFDPFFSTKQHGTGLGLSVAHGIIQEHGAAVDVDSKEGVGTTFYVLFPLVSGEEASA